jgi:hypothetical protein
VVEHHLAKVRVAGSSPVVRSTENSTLVNAFKGELNSVEWPRGEATDCKSVYTGSNPVSTSAVANHGVAWAIGAGASALP